jgi:hypothetical protein
VEPLDGLGDELDLQLPNDRLRMGVADVEMAVVKNE